MGEARAQLKSYALHGLTQRNPGNRAKSASVE
jgi:hypothetical protein